ncbi:MAG: topoisomerase protein [Candidatus Woesebacteria bacterium GW2011_GWB1_43_14]|uniref:DNA topoisomerase 1 n=1 Tax=Candidatus Woesebacteria bacterium GW2011_GWB1_43_14 TaxID=1618578 RepID=A0A0G1DGX0_9BACT|nr:MAG: topoisomerase protein [Candidatus Woesebacteria bacterium GW2011_GWA1_39_11b]KKS77748.1 MAG: DNA topoisomerase I, DNA topoisomerase I [Candidatus Woesebacteria bacterium GW2011_GWC1_42_9]KKS96944.1 MAG: topoisomerase protein [Candidatus Woesebacteria bacterium GW2011_GWB1_43_14]
MTRSCRLCSSLKMTLIIVESPTKAKTLGNFLPKEYDVEATYGHIMDLPKSPISVDIENNFRPDYKVVSDREDTIASIQKLAKKSKNVFIATDPDREGEAIAAHVNEILPKGAVVKRIAFHEITKEAVEEAIKHPREIDKNLVNAQIARRVLDRLVGYKLSPLLWKKVRRGLSAGRVQSVALRIIIEREEEIKAFDKKEYWEITCKVTNSKQGNSFNVMLDKVDGKKALVNNKKIADEVLTHLRSAKYIVSDIIKKEIKRNPYPPYTTSTMTQSAAVKFGWPAKKTMSVAQKLYEQGMITYHRTDSLNIAVSAIAKLRAYIVENYGEKYLSERVRVYKTKSKSAQEAHEAIRPTEVTNNKSKLVGDQKKLYELIWTRFVACQMAFSISDRTRIDVLANGKKKYLLKTSGEIVKFDGWRKVLVSGAHDVVLPDVLKGEDLSLIKADGEQKFTQPPARYNEASLIKKLEELGIGRPSTYAPTISTIMARNYVEKEDRKFLPTPVGEAVNSFLVGNFPTVFEYGFTAQMEDNLDRVAEGKLAWTSEIKKFWGPFNKKILSVEKKAKRIKIRTEKLDRKCPECKKGQLVVRVGRFGKFISCERFPDCKYTEKFVQKIGMKCPKCKKGDVVIKKTRKGRPFFGCFRYPDCEYASWKDPRKKSEKEKPASG